ncbi:hypothetical protein DY000_02029656 [Brassica cretica]|uniref:Uncharacterized protein n=1 Tax=Brassica cretica TaxID=69181 RepID=A0ABQ7DL43_BRACR|nr:hypothetical protein DY000_02029656 [Brassica cretica]
MSLRRSRRGKEEADEVVEIEDVCERPPKRLFAIDRFPCAERHTRDGEADGFMIWKSLQNFCFRLNVADVQKAKHDFELPIKPMTEICGSNEEM